MKEKPAGKSMKRADRVLMHLREDGRKKFSAIAKEEGVAVSTIFEHAHRLHTDVIERYVPLLRQEALGFPFRNISFWKPSAQELAMGLQQHPAVNTLLKSSGEVFIVEAFFRTMREQEQFLERLGEQGNVLHACNVIETIAQESWMPRE